MNRPTGDSIFIYYRGIPLTAEEFSRLYNKRNCAPSGSSYEAYVLDEDYNLDYLAATSSYSRVNNKRPLLVWNCVYCGHTNETLECLGCGASRGRSVK